MAEDVGSSIEINGRQRLIEVKRNGETGEIWGEAPFPILEVTPKEAHDIHGSLTRAVSLIRDFGLARGVSLGQMAVFSDLDCVLRDPFKAAAGLNPGNLPKENLTPLKELEKEGATIAGFITEQPIDGHQIAKVVGFFKGYPTMKRQLEQSFPKAKIISTGRKFFFPGSKGKIDFVDMVAEGIEAVVSDDQIKLIFYLGDRFEVDGVLWKEVQQKFDGKFSNKFVFVKVPSPFFDSKIGKAIGAVVS